MADMKPAPKGASKAERVALARKMADAKMKTKENAMKAGSKGWSPSKAELAKLPAWMKKPN